MKNLKIGKKLLVTFGIIILLFLFTIVMSIIGLTNTTKNFEDFYKNGYPVSNKTTEMRRCVQSAIKNISMSMLTSDKQMTEQYLADADAEMKSLNEDFDFMKKNFRGDLSLVTKAQDLMTQSKEYRTQVTELAAQNRNEEAADIFFNKYQPILLQAQDIFTEMDQVTTDLAAKSFASSEQSQVLIIVFLVVISVIALTATVILAIYITGSLKKPIQEIEDAAVKMSEGDLNVSIQYSSKDELGNLADKIRHFTETLKAIISEETYLLGEMAKGNFDVHTKIEELYTGEFQEILLSMRNINLSLSGTLRQINESSDQVSSGSEQVSSGAQALSQGATEQASSIEELAATINNISEQVRLNADNAIDASKKASETGEQLTESNQQMQEMIQAMSEISNSSNEISKIIKTIEDIAFQTNILALNAAVEAARAGAAGKGFAVVADEVRNLANKSQDASKNTAVLIEGSLKAVEHGTRIADETAASLLSAVEGAKIVADTVDKISTASEEQANSITQVTQGIDQISSVVQTNSATAEESAAASEELSGQAQLLKNLVGKFILRQETSQTPSKESEAPPALPKSDYSQRTAYSSAADKY